jgi:phospholipid/cholesterol/gamma-HCH transport system permease protein
LLAGLLNFFGATTSAIAQLALHPARLRTRELAAQLEQTCLNAIPVIALVTALIGVTLAYLLGLQAEQYGANIFVVDGVGIGMAREFGPVLVAVIVAGRSGAAFTAQLGSMKLAEEIDAIRALGLSPMQVLVVPRVLALLIGLPLLTFIGTVMGIFGAMLVAGPMLGLSPASFLDRLHSSLDMIHVWVGMGKTPFFAAVIASKPRAVIGSSPAVGSSMNSTSGSSANARAMAARLRIPPDNSLGNFSPASGGQPACASRTWINRLRTAAGRLPCSMSGTATFCATVSEEKSAPS